MNSAYPLPSSSLLPPLDLPARSPPPHGTASSYSSSRAYSRSRFTSLLRALWRLFVLAVFSLTALVYGLSSLLADAEYGLGMQTMQPQYFRAAAVIFPLSRTRRSGAAYYAIIRQDLGMIGDVQRALRHDPNAADLWYGLARMQLKVHDDIGYKASLTRLKELAPGARFEPVRVTR